MASVASEFDAEVLLGRLEAWCQAQPDVHLIRGPGLSTAELDAIPTWPTGFPYELPTPYDPKRFTVPVGYRQLLSRAGGLHVEHGPARAVWPVVHLFRPGDCSRAHSGARYTLCDSWSPAGTTVDDREITTTDLISFASAGLDVEASRWCFLLRDGAAPTVFLEDNDYECLTGRYVDTGAWLSELTTPAAPDFETWFTRLVEVVTAQPFNPDANDALVNALLRG